MSYNLIISGPSSVFETFDNQEIVSLDLSQLPLPSLLLLLLLLKRSLLSSNYVTVPFKHKNSQTYRLGTYDWTLSSDLSGVPIPGLPTKSYSGTFHTCIPIVPLAPVLEEPIKFQTIVGDALNFTWNDVASHELEDSCTPLVDLGIIQENFHYTLLSSRVPSFDSAKVIGTQSSIRSGSTSFHVSDTGFSAGTYYWKVQLEKEVSFEGSVVNTLNKQSRASIFTVCIETPPKAPSLMGPANDTVFPRCNITTNFMWEGMDVDDFGVDCLGNTFGIRIHVGTDMETMNDHTYEILYNQGESGLLSLITGYQPNTRYYWKVEAYNSHSSNFSETFSFVTPDTSIVACSGHGECVSGGTCSCDFGWTGFFCDEEIPTEAPSGTTGPGEIQSFPVGAVAGGVAGSLLALLILALLAFIFLKKRVEDGLKKPERTPPDFPPLAFTPPGGYPPLSQDKIVPWYSFEQLLLVNNFALSFAILDVTQATEIDDICKSLVYIAASHNQSTDLVKSLITKDLKEKKESNNLNSSTLFRDNSHASKAFKFFAKIVALPYLFYIFGDPVYDLCNSFTENKGDTPEPQRKRSTRSSSVGIRDIVITKSSNRNQSALFDQGNFEMDPNRMQDDDDDISNALFLQLKCQKLLVQILRSISIFPPSFAEVAVHLMGEVEQNLSREDGYRSIASFLFLRLINPSILFPYQYGLVDAPPDNEKLTRHLILITKVMQNLVTISSPPHSLWPY